MPTMIRLDKKSANIAYKIIGKPANLNFKPNKEQRWVNHRLQFEELVRMR